MKWTLFLLVLIGCMGVTAGQAQAQNQMSSAIPSQDEITIVGKQFVMDDQHPEPRSRFSNATYQSAVAGT